MQPRTSVADGFRVSASSTPSNSSGGSEPDDIELLGDVYIWGEVLADEVSTPDGTGIQAPSKTDVLIPKPIESSVVLDVRRIASGEHHLAIVTKRGEVFTWGEESGGRLGHGIDKDFVHPHLVKPLADATLDVVACGEYHTCAVSQSDDLFTWGDGTYNAGLLGNGNEASHWIPKRVHNGALEGLQVVSVSCGTWHSALATSNGKLFTFGDGTFGVLGHGDQESVLYPKEVQLLSGLKTIKVACGVWHTAAIVEVVVQSGSNASSWKLFTWGDGDKHRLGHGNKETYLRPTRVSPLIEYNFHQIACGHTMTVALTTSGHVFTMGGTENGQLGNPMAAGKVPTLVQDKLLGEFVAELSCGAHHVAVVTSRNEVYTWGKGGNGRLGHGDTQDRKSPTLVVALKDRNIKNISCGSNFTSCICIHKWVTETDQSVCFGCRQAFGITRQRHNCYNCGLVFCHACSSKKAMKAALAPTPQKPHRVCDNCYTKLKLVEVGDPSKFNGSKATPSQCSTISGSSERLEQGVATSKRTLFTSITEPMKYLEIKNNNPGTPKYGSTSFIRASQVPSLLQLKDVAFPSSLSSIESILKPATSPSPSKTPPPTSPVDSGPISQYTSKLSTPSSPSPRFSGTLVKGLRRTYDLLSQEVSNLQNQIQSLKQRGDMKDVEIQKLQRKATEAIALAAVESSNHREAKEFIKSSKDQLKEMTEKLPPEIPESRILKTMHIQAKDFLKEISEYETPLPSKLESKEPNALDIPAADSGSSKLQKNNLEENANAVRVHSCHQDGGNFLLEEINGSKLESTQENAIDLSTSNASTFELQQHKQEGNADDVVSGVDYCEHDGRNFHKEINGSLLESEQQNLPDHIPTSDGGTSRVQEDIEEKNDDTAAGVDQSQGAARGQHVLQESNGPSISSAGGEEAMSPLNSENGSRSLDSSRSAVGRLQETPLIEKFEPGVYVILILRPDGIKIFKRVKFSKRRFTENQAEEWWDQNKGRVLRKYCPLHQKLTTGSSNITPHAKENIEASPSKT